MASTVKTVEARSALSGIIRDEAQAVASRNDLISTRAEATLPAFIKDAADRVRAREGQVDVDTLVDSSLRSATAKWRRFNTRAPETLSPSEVNRIAADDPSLGALTRKAVLAAAGSSSNTGAERITQTRIDQAKAFVDNNWDGIMNGDFGEPIKKVDLMGEALRTFKRLERQGAGSYAPQAYRTEINQKPSVVVIYADDGGFAAGVYTPKGKEVASGSGGESSDFTWT